MKAVLFVITLASVLCSSGRGATVQGYKVLMPDYNPQVATIQALGVHVNGATQTANPYFFFGVPSGTATVTVDVPAGMRAGYVMCRWSESGCVATGRPLTAMPAGGLQLTLAATDGVDLWFGFMPVAEDPSPYVTISDSPWNGVTYSYSPTLIDDGGLHHALFCSTGGPGALPGRGAWDYIRYSSSVDGRTWTPAKIVLKNLGGLDRTAPGYDPATGGRGLATCDPSAVRWGQYWLLFYGGAYDTGSIGNLTDIEVARSTSIDGPYEQLLADGTWGSPTPSNPPRIVVYPWSQKAKGAYGAGQPTVSVRNGVFTMIYTDDTYSGVDDLWIMSTTDPTVWPYQHSQQVAIAAGSNDTDVKRTADGGYIMYRIDAIGQKRTLSAGSSADGQHWGAFNAVQSLPDGAVASGFSSDGNGTVGSSVLFGFAAPYGFDPGINQPGYPNWARWSLYGIWIGQQTAAPPAVTPPAAVTPPPAPAAADILMTMVQSGQVVVMTYRPSTGMWYVGGAEIQFGLPGDMPMVLDWNGGNHIAVYRPGAGKILVNSDNQTYHGLNAVVINP